MQFLESGVNVFELSQKSKETYLKADTETKRKLLKLVFENLTLDEEKLSYGYTKAFEILSKAVEFTNSSKITKIAEKEDKIFEQTKRPYLWGQSKEFLTYRPILLPREDSNL